MSGYESPPSWTPSLDDLAVGTPAREAVEEQIEAWIPNLGPGFTYDDLLDKIDGSTIVVEHEVRTLDLPGQIDDPVYVRLRNLAKRIRSESA